MKLVSFAVDSLEVAMALDQNKAREIANSLVGPIEPTPLSKLREERTSQFYAKFYARIMRVLIDQHPDYSKLESVATIARRVAWDDEKATIEQLQKCLHHRANEAHHEWAKGSYIIELPASFLGFFYPGKKSRKAGINDRVMIQATGWTHDQWMDWLLGENVPEPR